MKKWSEELEKKIADYLDEKLSPENRKAFEQTLAADPLLKVRLEEIRLADELLKQTRPDQPSKNFTTMVMSRLDQYPLRSGMSIRNGIMLLTGLLAVMTIAVVLLSSGVFDQQTTLDLNQFDVAQRYIKQSVPTVSINIKTIVNAILLFNLVLAFIVLDRTILKPLFNKRIETGQ